MGRRIWRMRPLSAALLCLPAVLLCAWYAWDAWAGFDRFRNSLAPARSLDLELFQLFVHDSLRRDWRRFTMAEPPSRKRLQRLAFQLDAKAFGDLLQGASLKKERPYVNAQLLRGQALVPVKMHLRGQMPWHLMGPKKSLKVKFRKGESFEGHRTLNLIHDPTPMVLGEVLLADLARELGLIVPGTDFARVQLNGADLGVFRTLVQVDESVIRAANRYPGSLYSGNLPPGVPSEALWRDPQHWKKVAWQSGHAKDRADIERFLSVVRSASARDFADFVRHELDLNAFARLDALEIAFGVNERDFRRNHKLYFDPYRGRWEPVIWSLRGFRHEPHFQLVDQPIGLRLQMHPGYLSLRAQELYGLLSGPASPTAMRRRGLSRARKLVGDLATDPYWDAYKLLPRAERFLRRLPRPMDVERWALAFQGELGTYAERHRFLMRELERNPLSAALGAEEAAPGQAPALRQYKLRLRVDGQCGVRLIGFEADWPADCQQVGWRIYRGSVDLAGLSNGTECALQHPIQLHPTIQLQSRTDASPAHGAVRAVPAPVDYGLRLISACRPERLHAVAIHLATGNRIRSRLLEESGGGKRRRHLTADQVPGLRSGEVGPHPWSFDLPRPEAVHLGPGEVEIAQSRVFGTEQSVVVEPGSRLRMGAGASLVFLGPVAFRGERNAPVEIAAATEQGFGGIAIQGPGTAGALLRNVIVRGGTAPTWRRIPFPATVNVHDTRGVRIEDCQLEANERGDFLHVASVEDLQVDGLTVRRSKGDGVDLEQVSGRLRALRLVELDDDGLDMMGASVDLHESVIHKASGNAISAGERTELRVFHSLLARSGTGVLSKNSSTVELESSLLLGNGLGVKLEGPTVFYPEPARLGAEVLFVLDSSQESRVARRSRLELGRLERRWPRPGVMEHLLRDVLELSSWAELSSWLSALEGRGDG
ncbi:MAG: CotH kinase family protein [Deltaproteobacteria bacterium]|nr:CotH kinase family protein [Deltaproteobacteria bacterium]